MRNIAQPPSRNAAKHNTQHDIMRRRVLYPACVKLTIFSEKVTESASTPATTVRNCLLRSLISAYSNSRNALALALSLTGGNGSFATSMPRLPSSTNQFHSSRTQLVMLRSINSSSPAFHGGWASPVGSEMGMQFSTTPLTHPHALRRQYFRAAVVLRSNQLSPERDPPSPTAQPAVRPSRARRAAPLRVAYAAIRW